MCRNQSFKSHQYYTHGAFSFRLLDLPLVVGSSLLEELDSLDLLSAVSFAFFPGGGFSASSEDAEEEEEEHESDEDVDDELEDDADLLGEETSTWLGFDVCTRH